MKKTYLNTKCLSLSIVTCIAVAWLVLGLALPTLSQQSVNAVQLSVKPDKCVTLYQGQTCHQTLVFTWSMHEAGDFCLYKASSNESLFCWSTVDINKLTVEFKSKQKEQYQIRRTSDGSVVAEVKVRLATVYKKSKKNHSGWRLF